MANKVERILGDEKENKGSFKFFAICENVEIKTSQNNNPYTVLSLIGYRGCRKDFVVFELLGDTYKDKLLIVDINYSSTGGTYKIVNIEIKDDAPEIGNIIIPPVSEPILKDTENNIKMLLNKYSLNLYHLIEPLKSQASSLFLYRRGEMFVQINNMLSYLDSFPFSQKEKITAFKVVINLFKRFKEDITSYTLKQKIELLSVLTDKEGDGVNELLEVLSDFLNLEKAKSSMAIVIVSYIKLTIELLETSLVDKTLADNQTMNKDILGIAYEIKKVK